MSQRRAVRPGDLVLQLKDHVIISYYDPPRYFTSDGVTLRMPKQAPPPAIDVEPVKPSEAAPQQEQTDNLERNNDDALAG